MQVLLLQQHRELNLDMKNGLFFDVCIYQLIYETQLYTTFYWTSVINTVIIIMIIIAEPVALN